MEGNFIYLWLFGHKEGHPNVHHSMFPIPQFYQHGPSRPTKWPCVNNSLKPPTMRRQYICVHRRSLCLLPVSHLTSTNWQHHWCFRVQNLTFCMKAGSGECLRVSLSWVSLLCNCQQNPGTEPDFLHGGNVWRVSLPGVSLPFSAMIINSNPEHGLLWKSSQRMLPISSRLCIEYDFLF